MSFTFRLDVSIHLNYLCLFQVVRGNSIILLEALDRIGWSVKVGGVNGQQWRMDFNFIDKDVWERICVWYCVHVWQDAVWGRNMLLYTCRLKSFNSFWLYDTFFFILKNWWMIELLFHTPALVLRYIIMIFLSHVLKTKWRISVWNTKNVARTPFSYKVNDQGHKDIVK